MEALVIIGILLLPALILFFINKGLKNKNTLLVKENNKLTVEKQLALEKVKTLEKETWSLNETIKSLKDKHKDYEQIKIEKGILEKSIHLLKKDNEALNTEIKSLKDKYQDYEQIKIEKRLAEQQIENLNNDKSELGNTIESLTTKYSNIIDIDNEVGLKTNELNKLNSSFDELKEKYNEANKVYQSLRYQKKLLKDDLDIAEFGVYEPQFDYETSSIFKLKIKEIRDKQKQLIKDDKAISGGQDWTVGGSLSKGKTMINRQKKLMLRAFNGECDNFINAVRWNNETRMEERIIKAADAISKMGESQGLKIRTEYSSLKLIELRLTHEYQIKKHEEKEQQRLIREQMREEEKARREFEKAQKDAEREEKLIQKAMEKAQQEISKASEEERTKYEQQLERLQGQLQAAVDKNKRAISMAQRTKAGHVYVISNIGSFGEDIYKIGMTRRLEPLDRVNELGDASVPFKFDVHAMIYSENAPELENQLHKVFDKFRLNHVNRRREYFNISLEEIEKVVKENHGEIEFIKEAEAKEYRESLVIIEKMNVVKQPNTKIKDFSLVDEVFN